jgi:hypothetical protein
MVPLGTSTPDKTGSRVRQAVRTVIRRPTSSSSGGLSGTGGRKPGLSDKIRK